MKSIMYVVKETLNEFENANNWEKSSITAVGFFVENGKINSYIIIGNDNDDEMNDRRNNCEYDVDITDIIRKYHKFSLCNTTKENRKYLNFLINQIYDWLIYIR